MFDGQIVLSHMADAGDSGSVIVRDDDLNNPNNAAEKHTVVGVHHTGNSTKSVACPLWNIGWQQQTDYVLPGSNPPRRMPSFTGLFSQAFVG